MTTFPLNECCEMLAIDAKTLRQWLQQAHMGLHAHPSDARVKCLTLQQVQQLATLHGRALAPGTAAVQDVLTEVSALAPPLAPPHAERASRATPMKAQISTYQPEPDLIRRLAHLETQVATLQQHVTGLALELLKAQTHLYEQRRPPLEAVAQPLPGVEALVYAFEKKSEDPPPMQTPRQQRRVHPAEQRPRSRVIPWVEYGASGSYRVICPEQGEIPLIPDSPEWFAWLSSVGSFRFMGKQGRLSVYRRYEHGPTRSWYAHRYIHQRNYKHHLGVTDHLTLARLEQMAAQFQSYVDTL